MRSRSKRFLRVLMGAVLTLAALCCLLLPAFAEESHPFTLETTTDIEIILSFEGAEPAVRILNPAGEALTEENIDHVDRAGGMLYIYIKGASSGSWNVVTDKPVTFTVLAWHPDLEIASFTLDEQTDDRAVLRAQVNSSEDFRYTWFIYAQREDENGAVLSQQLLAQTSGRTNREETASVSLELLPDGPRWRLYMEAFAEFSDGVEKNAAAFLDTTFSVTGHTLQGDAAELRTLLDLTEQTLLVDWSGVTARYDEMEVRITDEQGSALVENRFSSDRTETTALVDTASGKRYQVELHPIYHGSYAMAYTRTVAADPGVSITVDTPSATGAGMATVSYKAGAARLPVTARCNGKEAQYQLSGDGSFSIQLEVMENNELQIDFTVDGSVYRVSKTVSVHSFPPALELFGLQDGMKTDRETLTVSGATDPGVTVTVADKAVETTEDGSFSSEVALAPGENPIVFVCENAFGIKTVRTVTVYRVDESGRAMTAAEEEEGKTDTRLPLLFAAGVSLFTLLATLLAFLLRRKKKGLWRALLSSLRVLVLTCALAFGAACFYSWLQYRSAKAAISGSELTRLVQAANYGKISEGITRMDRWLAMTKRMALISGILLGAFVLLIILGIVVGKILKKRPPKAPGLGLTDEEKAAYRAQKQQERLQKKQQKQLKTPTVPDASPAFCPNCGAPMSPGSRFCGNCGRSI